MRQEAGSGDEIMASRKQVAAGKGGEGREREERVRVRRTSLWKAGSSEGFFSACAASLSAIHVSALVISSSKPVVS